ncbi:hypothetical protein [Fibrella aquatilis]|nr:hypothetical protein [Fibrella aquatilis]
MTANKASRLKTKAIGSRMPQTSTQPINYPTTIDLTIIFTI